MVLRRMALHPFRSEFRAQPAGHACGPPLREAAARMVQRAERRQRQRNHLPRAGSEGLVVGRHRGCIFDASQPRVQGLRPARCEESPIKTNCSQTPQQTGIYNWRQRGKDGRKRCTGRPRLVEIESGFSRASRSPALRRLAKLAPLASAREQLPYRYQNR